MTSVKLTSLTSLNLIKYNLNCSLDIVRKDVNKAHVRSAVVSIFWFEGGIECISSFI